MGDVTRRTKNYSADPIINFYAHALRFDLDQLPQSFPEENKPAFFDTLDTVPERNCYIITHYYGLDGSPSKTQKELSTEQQVSSERIRSLLSKTCHMLRHPYRMRIFKILLRTMSDYQTELQNIQLEQAKLQVEIINNPLSKDLLQHIEIAKAILKQLDESPAGTQIAELAQKANTCKANLMYLESGGVYEKYAPSGQYFLDYAKSQLTIIENYSDWLRRGAAALERCKALSNWSIDPNTSIEELNLSSRAFNCLNRSNITTVRQLAGMTRSELLKVRNMGAKTAEEVVLRCAEYGIVLPDE